MRSRLPIIFGALIGLASLSPMSLESPVARARDLTVEERLFQKAEPLCRAGKIGTAIDDLKRVLKLNPNHAGALYYAGVYRAEKGDSKGAAAIFRKILSDPAWGSLSRERLAELSVKNRQEDLSHSIKSYLEGEAWPEALQSCKTALQHSPGDRGLLFLTVYSAVMAGDKRYAEAAWNAFGATSAPAAERGDLRDFIDGWFCRDHAPREGLQRLMGIKDERLRTKSVRRAIRRLLLDQQLFDEYEQMLLAERDRPNSDPASIERELIKFYVDTGRYDKGMQLLARRPIDSMADNLLYIRLLSASGDHLKAMTVAQQLIGMQPDQPEPHEAFLNAYISFAAQKGGLSSLEPIEREKWERLVRQEIDRFKASIDPSETPATGMTLAALRSSVTLNDFSIARSLLEITNRLRIDDSTIREFRAAAEDMADNGFRAESSTLLEAALGQHPEDPGLLTVLAGNYYLDNRAAEAAAMLETVMEKDPRNIHTLLVLVDCLAASGQREQARNKLIDALSWTDLPDMLRNQCKAKLNLIDIGAVPVASTGSGSEPTPDEFPPTDAVEPGTGDPPQTATEGAYTGFDGVSAP
ncbi:tetratricopeptide repeat protein [Candidatus Ozemobacteraceae bacterium]|nr:tetratricopeptide repeat protein [Candidatus Ozemobacteraceae bacterium]